MELNPTKETSKPAKRRRGIVLSLVAVAVVGLVAVAVWPGEREPEYQGKKLSEWLMGYQSKRSPRFSSIIINEMSREAEEAVRQIGTNALPLLLKWVQSGTPAWKKKLASRVGKPLSARKQIELSEWLWREDIRAARAVKGFEILGEQASGAIPQLIGIMNEAPRRDVSRNAISALIRIGDAGAICVLNAVTNETVCLASRCEAAEAVRFIDGLYRERVYQLYRCIYEPKTPVELRESAVLSLALFRTEAPARYPSIEGLRQLLNDSSLSVRSAARDALMKIAPEALTNGVSGVHE